ncbi:methyl-accepting chemotaxis protein [Brevibacillus sp. SYSU BS000544]|uniref:methyl-accepting chemotaxis protein n=1 Tax=Brevibacillus sp. SYSU BS000544 TaxID=3416443 RepID=UPI003CE46827
MLSFRNLTTFMKILVLLLIAVIFLVGVGITGYYNMQNIKVNSDSMYDNNLLPIDMLNKMRINNRAIDSFTLELMINVDQSKNQELKKAIEERVHENIDLMNQYEKSELEFKEKAIVDQYKMMMPRFNGARDKAIKLAMENHNNDAYQIYTSEVAPVREQLNKLLSDLAQLNIEGAQSLNTSNDETYRFSTNLILAATILAVILCLSIGLVITRQITTPVRMLQELMRKASQGDLSVEGTYRSKDEIGQLTNDFNEMISGIRLIIQSVSSNAVNLAASSEQLSASAEQTTQATNQIAHSIQEVATGAQTQLHKSEESARAMEEMASGIQRIAESSSSVAESSLEASKTAEDGNVVISKVVTQMNEIQASVQDSAQVVEQLNERSKQIGQFVEVITAIAGQTNLLALNAAIEAARAGEHGRGFSIVADEVRKLAEQSKNSADHISKLIGEIQSDTNQAIISMDKGNKDVEAGIVIVNQAGEAFQKILRSVQLVAEQIQEVSASAEEMSATTEEVAASVEEMEQVAKEASSSSQMVVAASQEQLASVEEISSSSQSLAQMAQDLQALTSKFKL